MKYYISDLFFDIIKGRILIILSILFQYYIALNSQ